MCIFHESLYTSLIFSEALEEYKGTCDKSLNYANNVSRGIRSDGGMQTQILELTSWQDASDEASKKTIWIYIHLVHVVPQSNCIARKYIRNFFCWWNWIEILQQLELWLSSFCYLMLHLTFITYICLICNLAAAALKKRFLMQPRPLKKVSIIWFRSRDIL